jgi:hypothetical protein
MQAIKEKGAKAQNVDTSGINSQVVSKPATPSIGIKNLKKPAKVVAQSSSIVLGDLELMEQSRMLWETTELAASNKRLYSILKSSYAFYKTMKEDENKIVREARCKELDKFIEARGYIFGSTTHDMTRVVKCVFGTDRRRVSAYSIALREALRQNVSIDELIDFLGNAGGVEQIRMGGTKPETPKKRAQSVSDEVYSNQLCQIKIDSKLIDANSDWNDKPVVIIATYRPTGYFEANAVVKHDGAVTGALAAYKAVKDAKRRKQDSDQKKEEKETEKMFGGAAKNPLKNRKTMTAEEKEKKRNSAVKAEVTKRKREAERDAQFNKFFETTT